MANLLTFVRFHHHLRAFTRVKVTRNPRKLGARAFYRCTFLPVTRWAARAERDKRLRFSVFRFAKTCSARLLYPRQRTFLAAVSTPEKCHIQTSLTSQNVILCDVSKMALLSHSLPSPQWSKCCILYDRCLGTQRAELVVRNLRSSDRAVGGLSYCHQT